MNAIMIFKVIHVVGFVSWFAGLFYLVRMFVYHTEAFDEEEPKRSILTTQFHLMQQRVYKIICNPGMMLTWTCGIAMIYLYGWEWYKANIWLHYKIGLLILLTIYHLYCKRLIAKLKDGKIGLTSFQFRLFNEIPTLFLIVIVAIAVFKNTTDPVTLILTLIGFIIFLIVMTKVYKSIRAKNPNA